jgi:hypothetical protein
MRRWSGVAGILFVVLAVVSRAVRGSLPDTDSKDALANFTKFYADTSHNDHAIISLVVGFAGLFAFVWFLGGVWSALRTAEGQATPPTIIVAVGGAAYIAAAMIYHLFADGLGVTLHFSDGYTIDHGFDPGLAVVLASLAAGAFIASMLAAGVATAAAGVVIMRTKTFPVWLAWLGIAIGVLCLPAIPALSFIAALLFAAWVLIVSGFMLGRSERHQPDDRLHPAA